VLLLPGGRRRLNEFAVAVEIALRTLRSYHATVIAPYHDRIQARIDAQGAIRARLMLHDGIEAVLAASAPPCAGSVRCCTRATRKTANGRHRCHEMSNH
jgi:hypothetical protein